MCTKCSSAARVVLLRIFTAGAMLATGFCSAAVWFSAAEWATGALGFAGAAALSCAMYDTAVKVGKMSSQHMYSLLDGRRAWDVVRVVRTLRAWSR